MGLFHASDGALNIGVSGDGMWQHFCEVMGETDWKTNSNFATVEKRRVNRESLNKLVAEKLKENTVTYWVELLLNAGIPAGPVYNVPDMLEDPQVRHLNVTSSIPLEDGGSAQFVTQPVTLSRTPGAVSSRAPGLGEHTKAVLSDFGFSKAQITQLKDDNVI